MLNFSKEGYQKLVALFSDSRTDVVRHDLAIFFGSNADSYLKSYEKMRKKTLQGSSYFITSWSWPVFFLSFVWFFYRKMYVVGAAAILIPIILGLLFGPTTTASILVFPMFAKAAYIHTALGSILKADAFGISGVDRDEYLRRAGGVSLLAGILATCLFAIIIAGVIFAALVDGE